MKIRIIALSGVVAAAVLLILFFSSAGKKNAVVTETAESPEGISINEIFFYFDIEGGELLATSEGALDEQSERAALFVPPGGGEESVSHMELIHGDERSIAVRSDGRVTEYHLYTGEKVYFIIVYEKEEMFRLLRYESEKLSEISPDALFPEGFSPSGSFEFSVDGIKDLSSGVIYTYRNGIFKTGVNE